MPYGRSALRRSRPALILTTTSPAHLAPVQSAPTTNGPPPRAERERSVWIWRPGYVSTAADLQLVRPEASRTLSAVRRGWGSVRSGLRDLQRWAASGRDG